MGSFYLNEFLVIPANDQIRHHQQSHKLEPKAMAVLVYLVDHRDRIVSMEDLLENVWQGSVVTPQTVQRCISILRKIFKQADDELTYIQTFSKKGYQLTIEPHFEQPVAGTNSIHPKPKRWFLPTALTIFSLICLVALATLFWGEREAEPLFQDDTQIFAFAPNPSNDWIAYLHRVPTNHNLELFVRQPGGEPISLAELGWAVPDAQLSWSQDGQRLLVMTEATAAKFSIFEMNWQAATGLEVWHLEDAYHYYHRVALMDDKTLYFTRTVKSKHDYHLYKMDLTNAEVTLVEPGGNVLFFDTLGDQIAYSIEDEFQHHIRLRNLNSGEVLVRATHDKAISEVELFSEGEALLRTNRANELLLLNLAGVKAIPSSRYSFAELEADDGQLLFTAQDDVSAIYVRDVSECCLGQKEFMSDQHSQYAPSWSHDGSQVAMVSERSGLPQIWISQGDDLAQISRFTEKVTLKDIHWSEDSQWLVFQADHDIYACSLVVKSCESLVEQSLYVRPLGFDKKSSDFFYVDENGFEMKVWRQSLSSQEKSVIDIPDESELIILNDKIIYKPENSRYLYQVKTGGAELLSDNFPEKGKFLAGHNDEIYYHIFERHNLRNIRSFNLTTKQHGIVVKRPDYFGHFEDYDGTDEILATRFKARSRSLYSISLDAIVKE